MPSVMIMITSDYIEHFRQRGSLAQGLGLIQQHKYSAKMYARKRITSVTQRLARQGNVALPSSLPVKI